MSTKFNMFPIPKYLKIVKVLIPSAIKNPRLLFAVNKDKVKNSAINNNKKNTNTFIVCIGSVK